MKEHKGAKNPNWKGGFFIKDGYRLVIGPEHPRAVKGYVREHLLIAERALGRPLPLGSQVHHVNGRSDNLNLVICQDDAYHKILHARMRVQSSGGNPNTEKICCICKALKPRCEFNRNRNHWDGYAGICRKCARASQLQTAASGSARPRGRKRASR